MEILGFQDFIQENYPDIYGSYLAYSDPDYFKVGEVYQPMVSGYGGSGKRYKSFICIEVNENAIVLDGQSSLHKIPYVVSRKDAHFHLSKLKEQ